MYVLESKKTGIHCGWSEVLWKTGGFELIDDGSGAPTPPKVVARIEAATGLNVMSGGVTPASAPVAASSHIAPVEPPAAPETTVTDAADPANVDAALFVGDDGDDAEDDS